MSEIKVISVSNGDWLEARMTVKGISLDVVDVFGRTQIWVNGECFHEPDWTPAMQDCARLFGKMREQRESDKKQAKAEKRKAILAKLQ